MVTLALMKKRISSLSILTSLLAAPLLFANGGGYFRSGIGYTGTVSVFEPSGTQSVRIMDELLTVDVGQKAAHVEVRYVLKNQTDKRTKVRFGFPVEQLTNDRESIEFDPESEEQEKKKKKPVTTPVDCRNYSVELAGKRVAAKFEGQPIAPDERFVGIRGWLVSEVSFAGGEEKTMTIRYDSDYMQTGNYVSDDSVDEARVFKYRLSTGAAWDGPIERGRIVVRGVGVKPQDLEVLKPLNHFKKTDAGWEWVFENLEPTLADDIEVQAVPEARSYGHRFVTGGYVDNDQTKPVTFKQVGKQWHVEHHNYAVKASSELPPHADKTYKADNIRGTYEGVWCEGARGNGVGEWLELTPEIAQPLDSIEIVSGYAIDDELYSKNARPKTILVTLNDSHTFEARLSDSKDEQLIPVMGYDQPVKKLRLTVKEVYPGSRYEDMCISDVALAVKLDKAPKIQPAR